MPLKLVAEGEGHLPKYLYYLHFNYYPVLWQ